MRKLSFDYKNALGFISEHEISYLEPRFFRLIICSMREAGREVTIWVGLNFPMGTTGKNSAESKSR